MEVIIGLIIVLCLAALLYPAVMRAKRRAHTATAFAHLRQLYVAGEIYRENHGERIFPHTSQFARDASTLRLLASPMDPFSEGYANRYREYRDTRFPDIRVHYRPATSYRDTVLHISDVLLPKAVESRWVEGKTPILAHHIGFEPSLCSGSPFGIWGAYLRVLDSGSIETRHLVFSSQTVAGGRQTVCSQSGLFLAD